MMTTDRVELVEMSRCNLYERLEQVTTAYEEAVLSKNDDLITHATNELLYYSREYELVNKRLARLRKKEPSSERSSERSQ